MSELVKNDLIKYLSYAKDLELSCYTQEQYIKSLKSSRVEAQNPRLIGAYSHESAPGIGDMEIGSGIKIGAIIGGILGAIFGFVMYTNGSEIGSTIKPILFGVLVGAAIGLAIKIAAYTMSQNETKSANAEIDNKNRQIALQNKQIEENAKAKVAIIDEEIAKATQQLHETLAVKAEFYSANVLYPKYRALVPVTMFCEYIDSGRCDALSGHEGAYNIYENELRLNLIVSKLEDVITQIDKVSDNQYMLANMIHESNNAVYTLSNTVAMQTNQLQSIDKNTEVAAYHSKITADNAMFMSWLEIQKTKF